MDVLWSSVIIADPTNVSTYSDSVWSDRMKLRIFFVRFMSGQDLQTCVSVLLWLVGQERDGV
jgi:hypothetical protein